MAKKNKRKSRAVDFLIGLLFSGFVGYLINTGLKTLFHEGGYKDNLFDPVETISWIIEGEMHYKTLVFAFSFGVFALFMNGTSNKDGGYKNASAHGAYGDAEFSSLEALREVGFIASKKESKYSTKDPYVTLSASEGIILGRENNELLIIPPNSKLDNRNVYVVGSSGSAKGQAFVIDNIINNQTETIIVTDPKGELYNLTSDIKKDQGYKVFQIDFLNLKGNRYNPLDYVRNDFQSIKLAHTISVNSAKDVKQDFFFNTAKDLLTGLIIYVNHERHKFKSPSISRTVKGLFNKISEDEKFLKELSDEIGVEHPSYQYFKDASVATGNTRTSILQSFAQQTGIFSLGDVARLTEESDINFYDLQNQKSILYVKVPIKDNPVPALTATFFDQLIDTLYLIGDENGSKLKIPTIFLLDEFANLGKINGYDNVLSTCRGYEMSMVTIVQDFAQMEQLYSKEIARTIVNNHDTTLFLRTKDVETAKYFERLAGNTTINFKTKGTSGGGGFIDVMLGGNTSHSHSTNEQYIQKPLIAEYELLNMSPTDKCYVFMTGHVLELKKAYQSLIYKDFITKQDGLKNGKPNYVYCYPENRETYIKKFNLKPNIPIANIPDEPTEAPLKNTNDEAVTENVISPVAVGVTNNKEEALKDIVNSFFESIENKNTKETSNETIENEVNVEETIVSTNLVEELAKKAGQQFEVESDPDELNFLQEISRIGSKVEQTDELIEELQNKRDLFIELSFDDEVVMDTKEEFQDIDDELPLG